MVKEKFFDYLNRLFLMVFLCSILFVLGSLLYVLIDISQEIKVPALLVCIGFCVCTALLAFLFLWIYRIRWNPKYIPYIIFFVSLFLHILVILFIHTPVISDFKTQWLASQQILHHEMGYQSIPYFIHWKNQIGFSIYEAILCLIHDSQQTIRVVNAIASSFTVLFTYEITKHLFSQRTSCFITIGYMLSIFPCTYVSVLSNQIPAVFLVYFALFLLIVKPCKRPFLNIIFAAVALALSELLRPEAVLILVPYLVYQCFSWLHGERLKKVLLTTLVFFASYTITFEGLNKLSIETGVAPLGLKSDDLTYKFLVGTNYESKGKFSKELTAKIDQLENTGMDRKQAELMLLKESASTTLPGWSHLFLDKTSCFWWERNLKWSMNTLYRQYHFPQRINEVLVYGLGFLDVCQFFLFFLLLLPYWFSLWKRKSFHKEEMLLPYVFFTVFIVFLFVEVQSRYAYIVQPIIYIMAAGGIKTIEAKRKERVVR